MFMHHSVRSKNFDKVKQLFQNGADVNAVDVFGGLPIAYARHRDQLDILEFLLSAGTKFYELHNYGEMQFATVFKQCDISLIKKYLEYNLDLVNAKDRFGNTAIHYLMCNRWEGKGIADILENVNFNVNIENLSGDTLLSIAIKSRNYECVNMLLKKGANLNHQNKKMLGELLFFMVLHEAEPDLHLMKLLIEKGADVNFIYPISLGPTVRCIVKLTLRKQSFEASMLILKHLAIMEVNGCTITDENVEAIEKHGKAKIHYSMLKEELKKMMELKYYENVSYFDILNEKNINRLGEYFYRIGLRKVFKDIICYFPHYCDILENKFIIGVEKVEEIRNAEEMLSEIFDLRFPLVVITKIATYYCWKNENL